MPVKKTKPITPGQRGHIGLDFSGLTKIKPLKRLLGKMHKTGGRNNDGRRTNRQQGGGHKRRYRIIDFKRRKWDVPAVVKGIEYDPNRSAHIARLSYRDGETNYILSPEGLAVGMTLLAGEKIAPEIGNAMPLKNIPMGTFVHNIELRPGQGGAMVRGAGGAAQLMAKEEKYVTLKLPSKERRKVLKECMATIGKVSNGDHIKQRLGKAGRNRWLGNRPRVRGVAMNPVDHKMGGGNGKASGGHPTSRNGLPAKGKITRKLKKHSTQYIVSSRRKNKK